MSDRMKGGVGVATAARPLAAFSAWLRTVLPTGRTLPEAAWRNRHRRMAGLLFAEAIALGIFSFAQGGGLLHSAGHTAVLIPLGVAALLLEHRRRAASVLVSLGLITACALLVHIWDGAIEGHFLFFVTIVVLALYEDWIPFLVAAAYVVVHHGLAGAIDPSAVYNHPDAVAHPWKWAAIHGSFVVAAGLASVAAWRLNETVRAEAQEAYRRAMESAEELAHQALHDSLTGLGNRRALLTDLERQLEQATIGRPLLLLLFDLDGFKTYNDTFGHPAGDLLLTRVAKRLEAQLGDRASAYRVGGDEFCILSPRSEDRDAIVDLASEALAERGEGFAVTASYGAVLLPIEAGDATDALRIADRRMYARKSLDSRSSAGRQSADVLLRILSERSPALGVHLNEVTGLCDAVAERLAVPDEDRAPLLQAASLHDAGKAAIPDGILRKRGSLDDDEQAFLRRHTLIGERILSAAPALARAARLVRWSHERFDGKGYPDGLAGERIPLGARIIAVCDAYDALVCDRPDHQPIGAAEARDALRRRAGGEFDPGVVEVFCDVLEERERDALGAVGAPSAKADSLTRLRLVT